MIMDSLGDLRLFGDDAVAEIGFSNRLNNAFARAGIENIGQVVLRLAELSRIQGLGSGCMSELFEKLNTCSEKWEFGLTVEARSEATRISGSDRFIFDPCGMLCRIEPGVETCLSLALLNDDAPIEVLSLPESISSRLIMSELTSVCDVASKREEQISAIKGMGAQKIAILQKLLKEREATCYLGQVEEHEKPVNQYRDISEATLQCAYSLLAKYRYPINERSFYLLFEKRALDNLEATSGNMLESARLLVESYEGSASLVQACMRELNRSLDVSSDENVVPQGQSWEAAVLSIVREADDLRYRDEGRVLQRVYPSLEDWVQSVQGKHGELLTMRLDGVTLQDCGNSFGITRERVRQIVAKVLESKPRIIQDKYRYLYDHYDLSKESFCVATRETQQAYNYLEIISKAKKSQKRKICEALYDPHVGEEIKKAIIGGGVDSEYVYPNGERVGIDKESIVEYLLRAQLAGAVVAMETLLELYEEFINAHNLKSISRLNPTNLRAFAACVQRYECSILTLIDDRANRIEFGVRYFDVSVNLEPLWDALRLQSSRNIECSAELLIRDATVAPIVEKLDIRNGYELHSVIAKFSTGLEGITLERIPMMILGSAQRDFQILSLIKEAGSIPVSSLADAYENRYGVRASTFAANFLRGFELYQEKGKYRYVHKELTAEESNFLLTELHGAGGYLPIDDLKERYIDHFPEGSSAVLSEDNAGKLGFRVSEALFVRNELDLQKVFSDLIVKYDRFDMETPGFGEAVFSNSVFRSVLNRALRRFEVIEYEKTRYINVRVVMASASGFGVSDLEDYLDCALKVMIADVPYTLKTLAGNGFTHRIEILRDQLNVGDRFFESLLSIGYVGGNLKRTSFEEVAVFCVKSGIFSSSGLLEYIVESYGENGSLSMMEMIAFLNDRYGIETTPYKVRIILSRSPLHYDADFDVISFVWEHS